ncbi:MAG: tetratricopeptide repeat protein [Cyclobacteriaceae bacterium]
MKKFLLLLTFLTGQLMALNAQNLRESALGKFNNQEWESSIKDYLKYLKKNDGDSSDWYNVAIAHSRLAKHEEAIKYYTEAKERNYNSQFTHWGITKSYAIMKDEKNMLSSLKLGAENGLATFALLQSDPAFADYQESREFKEALRKVELNAYPCLTNEDYRHFDFWLGEWDVYVQGNKVGQNSITMAKGGCAIHENYTTARNYAGQSINFYDPIDQKWHQHWVGSGGDTYNYLETQRGDGMLQFESEFMNPGGNITLSRLTFTLLDDGTVRQLFESSSDDGKTWTSAFDGIYKKKD